MLGLEFYKSRYEKLKNKDEVFERVFNAIKAPGSMVCQERYTDK
jgi:hypothetical protein